MVTNKKNCDMKITLQFSNKIIDNNESSIMSIYKMIYRNLTKFILIITIIIVVVKKLRMLN
jgi:hypothetical protein